MTRGWLLVTGVEDTPSLRLRSADMPSLGLRGVGVGGGFRVVMRLN